MAWFVSRIHGSVDACSGLMVNVVLGDGNGGGLALFEAFFSPFFSSFLIGRGSPQLHAYSAL